MTYPVVEVSFQDGGGASRARLLAAGVNVNVGDLVLLVDASDGAEFPMATWGRVTKYDDYVEFERVGDTDHHSGILYVKGAWER